MPVTLPMLGCQIVRDRCLWRYLIHPRYLLLTVLHNHPPLLDKAFRVQPVERGAAVAHDEGGAVSGYTPAVLERRSQLNDVLEIVSRI